MTRPEDKTPWSRRQWLQFTSTATLGGALGTLSGCGGGVAVGVTALLPGTGGTGQIAAVFARGFIAGFGSVIVNGIRFDDSAASVQVDGISGSSSALRLGMVIDVQGERGADLTLGTARSIAAWSVAQGVVGSVLPGGVFTVAGITVATNANTVLDGLTSMAALGAGQQVTVWGLQADASASRWTATRVALAPTMPASSLVSTGLVQVIGGVRYVNGLRLAGTAAQAFQAGQLVRVQGSLSSDGSTLQVQQASVQGLTQGPTAPTGEAEIEGVVTAMLSTTRFKLGDVEVDASQATVQPTGAALSVGTRLDVDGVWQSGVLLARSIEIEDQETEYTLELAGYVEQYVSATDFVVRSQRCDASKALLQNGTLADLRAGVLVQLKGVLAGSVLQVTELEFDH